MDKTMLLEFGVTNYKSFSEETILTMAASREQRHKQRIPRVKSKYNIRVLPVAGLYGANASGKSNLVSALATLRRILSNPITDDSGLPYEPYKLDEQYSTWPTIFRILFIQDEQIYEYTISYNRDMIVDESLVKIRSRDEVLVFERQGENLRLGEVFGSREIRDFLSSVDHKIPAATALAQFKKVNTQGIRDVLALRKWINRLVTIYAGFLTENRYVPLPKTGIDFMKNIGAGIEDIKRVPVELDDISLPDEKRRVIVNDLDSSGKIITFEQDGVRYEAVNLDGEIKIQKVLLLHSGQGASMPFNWSEESDGTKAVGAIYPLIWALAQRENPPIVVIDEIDRSFHTLLTLNILESFLSRCNEETRAQLLFTTHDLLLMDLDVFRKDEIWIMEKSRLGSSRLVSLVDFKGIRKDRDLRKSYLEGRFGGIPNIRNLRVSDEGRA
ncbi:ATP-binding protein [Corynebacterium sp. MSK151]|uniref:AAA family ATPase n=1 Tax=unclassified Corynebacterium TaxID=2624378 RepID=UPI00254F8D79|nr:MULTISPECIES: ATP-binding protein [unclassified Corynebacterium]MDK8759977.1 ATP-binding protein [Corynebacterium sp. MSK151]MDK8848971.1 ATP-binding protein [Corynebacterium sp. MSK047]